MKEQKHLDRIKTLGVEEEEETNDVLEEEARDGELISIVFCMIRLMLDFDIAIQSI